MPIVSCLSSPCGQGAPIRRRQTEWRRDVTWCVPQLLHCLHLHLSGPRLMSLHLVEVTSLPQDVDVELKLIDVTRGGVVIKWLIIIQHRARLLH